MSNTPLQQFSKKESAWRFLKLALKLRAPQPAFQHVLIQLADYADDKGVCWPSHRLLMELTGYESKNTIVAAMRHWKSIGVLTWRKGWGNAHGRKSNVYQFHESAMRQQIAESSRNSDDLDEGTLVADEGTLATDEGTLRRGRRNSKPHTNVLALERTSSQKDPALNEGFARPSPLFSEAECTPTESHPEEQPINGLSSESAIKVPSSPAHDIPDALTYDDAERRWLARRDIGRALTTAEYEAMQRLNRERIRPQ